ncbi:MAG: class I SAM-dependent methyltransferase [Anaerolineae bacterium]|nr:class I SAM-dependent methyltransferase [Anaerolineae bacterium]
MPEYVDYAEYYDSDHNSQVDVGFYLGFARQCGSPILELACGTGRLVIPLAEAGFKVYGVDLSESMLAVCRRKVEERHLADRVHLTLANMADFALSHQDFALAYIPVRSFMHLFTQRDQLSCLQRVHDHLRPGGYFIVDVYAPHFGILAQAPNGPFVVRREFNLPNGHHVIRKDRFVNNDIVNQIQHCELRFEEYDTTGVLVRERTVPMDTRYAFRYELQLLLGRVGFEVIDIFRDYAKNPYDGTGEIIAVARRP